MSLVVRQSPRIVESHYGFLRLSNCLSSPVSFFQSDFSDSLVPLTHVRVSIRETFRCSLQSVTSPLSEVILIDRFGNFFICSSVVLFVRGLAPLPLVIGQRRYITGLQVKSCCSFLLCTILCPFTLGMFPSFSSALFDGHWVLLLCLGTLFCCDHFHCFVNILCHMCVKKID